MNSETRLSIRLREVTPEGQLIEPFQARLRLLIAKLRTMDGFIDMGRWTDMDLPQSKLKDAMSNPCGTACCLAGKAGLMPEFHKLGFKWKWEHTFYMGFTIEPEEFFGHVIRQALFAGDWTMANLSTPRQAVLVMEHLLDDPREAAACGSYWMPAADIRARVHELAPAERHFPVSQRREAVDAHGAWSPIPV